MKTYLLSKFAVASCLVLVPISAAAVAQTPPSGPTAAQRAASERLGRPVSNQEVLEAIRRSGLSLSELRGRLRMQGLDTTLADPFFQDGLAFGDGTLASAATASTLLGLLGDGDTTIEGDTTAEYPREDMMTFAGEYRGRVFGKNIFGRSSTAFEPATSGPVDPSYRLAVGDQLQMVLTGEVERLQTLEIRRDGTVLVPQVGQVPLAGLTLESARTALRQRAAQAFSGINTGGTRLDLSVSRVRTSQVYVIGEVERPGAYQVSSLATVFHALTRAGGPTERGSFRNVQVRRAGELVKEIDLYDYLLQGDASSDIRVLQGDIIFVPLVQQTVEVRGSVRRPAIFELREGEGFQALRTFFGGLLASAATDRIQVDRILPPDQRAPGVERVVVDVPLRSKLESIDSLTVYPGDILTVFGISRLRRNAVELKGQVQQPGVYQLQPGMTLGTLLDQAQGLLPWALRDRIQVTRPIRETGRSQFIEVSLLEAGDTLRLTEFDEVTVLDGRLLYPSGRVTLSGAVNSPGDRPFLEGLTLKGVIDAADGFTETASSVELARRVISEDYSDTTSVIYRFPVDSDFGRRGESVGFLLMREDRLFVHSSPGVRDQRTVLVSGLFRFPGSYVLANEGERLKDLVDRAGGLLPTASADAFRLVRNARPVAIDLSRAMAGHGQHNIVLEAGDQLVVGAYEPTVLVRGAVQRSVLVLFDRGKGLGDYVEAAGGLIDGADKGRITVEYPSGQVSKVKRTLLVFRNAPKIEPGAVINVPTKPAARESKFPQTLSLIVQTTTGLLSLLIGYLAVTR